MQIQSLQQLSGGEQQLKSFKYSSSSVFSSGVSSSGVFSPGPIIEEFKH
jgi:hypothetical protein